MKINNRLKNVANFVLKDSNVIEVGCDHALLCIYLASNYPNMRLIASDVREGPLKQAKANIEKYGLEDRITLKLGDGIATIDNDTNVIVISGMGGITIADIITKNKEKLDKIDQIVVSPNNDFYAVRSEITKLGFIIDREELIKERDKFYLIISFVKGKKKYKKRELYFGSKCILYDKTLREYYKGQFLLLFNKYSRLPDKRIFAKHKIKVKIDMLADDIDMLDKKQAREERKMKREAKRLARIEKRQAKKEKKLLEKSK